LSVGDKVSSAEAGAGTISVVKVGAKVRIAVSAEVGIAIETIGVVGAGAEVRIVVGAEAGMEISVEVGIEVSVKAGIAIVKEIKRTGLIVGVFRRFKVKVVFFSKS
jgi:hypothetical protein